MSDKKFKAAFAAAISSTVGLPESIVVHKGQIHSKFMGSVDNDGYAWIGEGDNGVKIGPLGRQKMAHGRDFYGEPRTDRYNAKKAHLGITAGTEVYYVEPLPNKKYSAYWILGADLEKFLVKLENADGKAGQMTIAVIEEGEDTPVWVGFAWDFVRHHRGAEDYSNHLFERFDPTVGNEGGEWVEGEDPRGNAELVAEVEAFEAKIEAAKEAAKPAERRTRGPVEGRTRPSKKPEKVKLGNRGHLAPAAEAAAEGLGPVTSTHANSEEWSPTGDTDGEEVAPGDNLLPSAEDGRTTARKEQKAERRPKAPKLEPTSNS